MEFAYYGIINLTAFLIMGWDKQKSIHNGWRIPEKYLLFFSLIGGAIGIFAGMYFWRHKTKKVLFYLGVPVLHIMHRLFLMLF